MIVYTSPLNHVIHIVENNPINITEQRYEMKLWTKTFSDLGNKFKQRQIEFKVLL